MNNQEKTDSVVFGLFVVMTIVAVFTSGCERDPCRTCEKLDQVLRNQASVDAMYASLNATYKTAEREIDRLQAENLRLQAIIPDPNEPPLYGNGDLPAGYVEMFGKTNGARLDFMQNRFIDEIFARVRKLETPISLKSLDPKIVAEVAKP